MIYVKYISTLFDLKKYTLGHEHETGKSLRKERHNLHFTELFGVSMYS